MLSQLEIRPGDEIKEKNHRPATVAGR